jgi:hypothetical protein
MLACDAASVHSLCDALMTVLPGLVFLEMLQSRCTTHWPVHQLAYRQLVFYRASLLLLLWT